MTDPARRATITELQLTRIMSAVQKVSKRDTRWAMRLKQDESDAKNPVDKEDRTWRRRRLRDVYPGDSRSYWMRAESLMV